MAIDVRPYQVRVPEADLIDLRQRLRRTRWPEPAPAPGWVHGIPLEVMRDLCEYWAEGYNWRIAETRGSTPYPSAC
jgi:hypothetical protein